MTGRTAVFLGWRGSEIASDLEALVADRHEVVFAQHFEFGEGVDQDAIASSGADYLFSYGPLLVRRPLLERIRIAAVNLHTGPPRWPGRGSVSFALLHGDQEFGVTAHLMVEELDAGPILRVHRFAIGSDDDVATLDSRTKAAIPELARAVLDDLEKHGPVPSGEQWERRALTQADLVAVMRIDDAADDAEVLRKVRAFAHPTKPGPYVERAGKRFWYLHAECRG